LKGRQRSPSPRSTRTGARAFRAARSSP
jgi:hypothetical protein